MKKLFFITSGLLAFVPLFVFAGDGILGILSKLSKILSVVIPILISIATVYFIWGVIQYLIIGGEEKKKKAKEAIFSGLIGLFIIIAFWGIVNVIVNTLGVGPEKLNPGAIPCVPNEAADITC